MAKKLASDKLLFTVVVLLTGFGLVMVYSASAPRARELAVSPQFLRQAAAAAAGLALMAAVMHLDYRLLRRPVVVYALVAGAMVALLAVLTQPAVNGTRRWFLVGPLSLQASEAAKLALVPFLAYQIDRTDAAVNRREMLLPTLFVVGMMAALVLAEPDLGTAAVLVLLAFVVLFLAGLRLRYAALLGALVVSVLTVAVFAADYRRDRWFAFLDPESDPLGSGYQALQSLIAIGSGGLWGLGQGASVQKLYYLPYPESDFIFAIVAEELGLVGALLLIAGFAVFAWRGVRAALRAPDRFGHYLALGLTSLITLQVLLNLGVAVALLPTKGMPLPFISYGGTSLVATLIASGVLLNVSEHG